MTDQIKRRLHSVAADDQRSPFQRDRDRILYSSAFRRLAGITQIVRAGEADVFHTRQQHTIKVAQIGRRIAERLIRDNPVASNLVGLDADLVEAACLAHDLGHPPFGHVGEDALNDLATEHKSTDGFEGNAQSFRVLTKLAVRFDECLGLDLTRGTLSASLKYPWLRSPGSTDRSKKWGAYKSEEEDLAFAREGFADGVRSVGASLMDWADDIAYSVHDLEDFQRCNAIPWSTIFKSGREQLIERAVGNWHGAPVDAAGRLRGAMRRIEEILQNTFEDILVKQYEGSRSQRREMRTMTSTLIGRYIFACDLVANGSQFSFEIENDADEEIKLLKQITRDYVIENPSLVGQQLGQKSIIRRLFEDLHGSTTKLHKYPPFLPTRLRYLWDASEHDELRFVIDCIASLTEAEAIGLHGRLTGQTSGSVFDPIIR